MKTLAVVLVAALCFAFYSAALDVNAPLISTFTFSSYFMNVSFVPVNLTITLRLTDNQVNDTGVHSALVQLRSPLGDFIAYDLFLDNVTAGSTPFNGTWRATANVPVGVDNGTWVVDGVKVQDIAGNEFYINAPALVLAGFNISTQLSIIIISIPDNAAPFVNNVTVTPTVNLALPNPHIDFDVGLGDGYPGTGVASAVLTIYDPNSNQFAVVVINSQQRVSGDTFDGDYTLTYFVDPQSTIAGTYTFGILVTDVKGNQGNFDPTALSNNHFPFQFNVINQTVSATGNHAATTGAGISSNPGLSSETSKSVGSLMAVSQLLTLFLAVFFQ